MKAEPNNPERAYPFVLTGYDLETTGLSPVSDRIIEFGAIKGEVDENFHFTEIARLHLRINPGFSLPEKITEITGITDEDLSNCPTEEEVVREIYEFFDGSVICGYNICSFDNKFMENLFARYGLTFRYGQAVDGLILARKNIFKSEVENYKLGTIAEYYGLPPFEAHSAMGDTAATIAVCCQLMREERERRAVSVSLSRPKPVRANYWKGYRGYSRIYVTLENQKTVFYEQRTHSWGGKDTPIEAIDTDWLEEKTKALLDVEDLAKYRPY